MGQKLSFTTQTETLLQTSGYFAQALSQLKTWFDKELPDFHPVYTASYLEEGYVPVVEENMFNVIDFATWQKFFVQCSQSAVKDASKTKLHALEEVRMDLVCLPKTVEALKQTYDRLDVLKNNKPVTFLKTLKTLQKALSIENITHALVQALELLNRQSDVLEFETPHLAPQDIYLIEEVAGVLPHVVQLFVAAKLTHLYLLSQVTPDTFTHTKYQQEHHNALTDLFRETGYVKQAEGLIDVLTPTLVGQGRRVDPKALKKQGAQQKQYVLTFISELLTHAKTLNQEDSIKDLLTQIFTELPFADYQEVMPLFIKETLITQFFSKSQHEKRNAVRLALALEWIQVGCQKDLIQTTFDAVLSPILTDSSLPIEIRAHVLTAVVYTLNPPQIRHLIALFFSVETHAVHPIFRTLIGLMLSTQLRLPDEKDAWLQQWFEKPSQEIFACPDLVILKVFETVTLQELSNAPLFHVLLTQFETKIHINRLLTVFIAALRDPQKNACFVFPERLLNALAVVFQVKGIKMDLMSPYQTALTVFKERINDRLSQVSFFQESLSAQEYTIWFAQWVAQFSEKLSQTFCSDAAPFLASLFSDSHPTEATLSYLIQAMEASLPQAKPLLHLVAIASLADHAIHLNVAKRFANGIRESQNRVQLVAWLEAVERTEGDATGYFVGYTLHFITKPESVPPQIDIQTQVLLEKVTQQIDRTLSHYHSENKEVFLTQVHQIVLGNQKGILAYFPKAHHDGIRQLLYKIEMKLPVDTRLINQDTLTEDQQYLVAYLVWVHALLLSPETTPTLPKPLLQIHQVRLDRYPIAVLQASFQTADTSWDKLCLLQQMIKTPLEQAQGETYEKRLRFLQRLFPQIEEVFYLTYPLNYTWVQKEFQIYEHLFKEIAILHQLSHTIYSRYAKQFFIQAKQLYLTCIVQGKKPRLAAQVEAVFERIQLPHQHPNFSKINPMALHTLSSRLEVPLSTLFQIPDASFSKQLVDLLQEKPGYFSTLLYYETDMFFKAFCYVVTQHPSSLKNHPLFEGIIPNVQSFSLLELNAKLVTMLKFMETKNPTQPLMKWFFSDLSLDEQRMVLPFLQVGSPIYKKIMVVDTHNATLKTPHQLNAMKRFLIDLGTRKMDEKSVQTSVFQDLSRAVQKLSSHTSRHVTLLLTAIQALHQDVFSGNVSLHLLKQCYALSKIIKATTLLTEPVSGVPEQPLPEHTLDLCIDLSVTLDRLKHAELQHEENQHSDLVTAQYQVVDIFFQLFFYYPEQLILESVLPLFFEITFTMDLSKLQVFQGKGSQSPHAFGKFLMLLHCITDTQQETAMKHFLSVFAFWTFDPLWKVYYAQYLYDAELPYQSIMDGIATRAEQIDFIAALFLQSKHIACVYAATLSEVTVQELPFLQHYIETAQESPLPIAYLNLITPAPLFESYVDYKFIDTLNIRSPLIGHEVYEISLKLHLWALSNQTRKDQDAYQLLLLGLKQLFEKSTTVVLDVLPDFVCAYPDLIAQICEQEPLIEQWIYEALLRLPMHDQPVSEVMLWRLFENERFKETFLTHLIPYKENAEFILSEYPLPIQFHVLHRYPDLFSEITTTEALYTLLSLFLIKIPYLDFHVSIQGHTPLIADMVLQALDPQKQSFHPKDVFILINTLSVEACVRVIKHGAMMEQLSVATFLNKFLNHPDFLQYQDDKTRIISSIVSTLYQDQMNTVYTDVLDNPYINLYILEHHKQLTFNQIISALTHLGFVPHLLSDNTLAILKQALIMPKYHSQFMQASKENPHVFLQVLLLPELTPLLKQLEKATPNTSELLLAVRAQLKSLTPFEVIKFLTQYYTPKELGRFASTYARLFENFYTQMIQEQTFVLSTVVFQLEKKVQDIQEQAGFSTSESLMKEAIDTLKAPFTQGQTLMKVIQEVMNCEWTPDTIAEAQSNLETLFEKSYNLELMLRLLLYFEFDWHSKILQLILVDWDKEDGLWVKLQNCIKNPKIQFQIKQLLDKLYTRLKAVPENKLSDHDLQQYISLTLFVADVLEDKRETMLKSLATCLIKNITPKNIYVLNDMLNKQWVHETELPLILGPLLSTRKGYLAPGVMSVIQNSRWTVSVWHILNQQLTAPTKLSYLLYIGSAFDQAWAPHSMTLYRTDPNLFLEIFETTEAACLPYLSTLLLREAERDVQITIPENPALMTVTHLAIRKQNGPYLKAFSAVMKQLMSKYPHTTYWVYNTMIALSRLHAHMPYMSEETLQNLLKIGLIDNQGLLTAQTRQFQRHAYLYTPFQKLPHAHQIMQMITSRRQQLHYFLTILSEHVPEFFFTAQLQGIAPHYENPVMGIKVYKEPEPFLSFIFSQTDQSPGHLLLLTSCLESLSHSLAGKKALSTFLNSQPIDALMRLIHNPSQSIQERIQFIQFVIRDVAVASPNGNHVFRRQQLASAMLSRLHSATQHFKKEPNLIEEILLCFLVADATLFKPLIETYTNSLSPTFMQMIYRVTEAQKRIDEFVQAFPSKTYIPSKALGELLYSFLDKGFTIVDLLWVALLFEGSQTGFYAQFVQYIYCDSPFAARYNESEHVEPFIFLHPMRPGKQIGRIYGPLLPDMRENKALIEALIHQGLIDPYLRLTQSYQDLELEQLLLNPTHQQNPKSYLNALKRKLEHHTLVVGQSEMRLEMYYKLVEPHLNMAETKDTITQNVNTFFEQLNTYKIKGVLSPEHEDLVFSFFASDEGLFDFEYARSFVKTVLVPFTDQDLIKQGIHQGRAHAMSIRLQKHGLLDELGYPTKRYFTEGLVSLARVVKGAKALENFIEKTILTKRQIILECLFIQFHLHVLLNTSEKQRWQEAFLALFQQATPHRWTLMAMWMSHHQVHVATEIQLRTVIEKQTGHVLIKLSAETVQPVLDSITETQAQVKESFEKIFTQNTLTQGAGIQKETLATLLHNIQVAV